MIEKVFIHKNQTENVANAMRKLTALNSVDKNKEKKAAGSLGGASRWKFIEFSNGHWRRTR